MAVLRFSPEADAFLTELEEDPDTRPCAEKVNAALDDLEADPGSSASRRRRYRYHGLRGIIVRCDEDGMLILWGPHPTDSDTLIVHSVGPDP